MTAALLAGAGEDDRAADRAAIRAHIDRIFQAFIHKDRDELRATHAGNWLGYLQGSTKMIRGIDEYMNATAYFDPKSPYGMTDYKMREFDMIFKGDAAFVAFVAEVESKTPSGPLSAPCGSPIFIPGKTANGFRTDRIRTCTPNR